MDYSISLILIFVKYSLPDNSFYYVETGITPESIIILDSV